MAKQTTTEDFYDEVSCITEKIAVKKRTPLHPYFTTQPYSLIQAYIKNFCRPDDLVLDMFGGSATTAREAALLNYRAIHVDLLPWSCFIAQNSCLSPDQLNRIEEAFARVERKAKSEIKDLYKLKATEANNLPIPRDFPSGVKLPSNSDVELLEELFTPRNRTAIMILRRAIQAETNSTHRRFLEFVFSGILARASKTYWKDKEGKGGGDSGIFKVYRYWVPNTPDERDVWDLFNARFGRVLKLIREDNKAFLLHPARVDIINCSATQLDSKLREESVDYIFTDPPYAQHIAYLDLSTMYHALLGFPVTEEMKRLEAIEGGDNAKPLSTYVDLIKQSFAQAHKVLKYNRWMTVVFTHKDPQVFTQLIEAACDVGFEYVNAVPQDTKRPSFHKTNNSLTVLKGQMMLNFHKRRNVQALVKKTIGEEAFQIILDSAQNTIVRSNGRATFSDIIHDLYEKLLAHGYLRDMTKDIKSIEVILNERLKRKEIGSELYFEIPDKTKITDLIPIDRKLKLFVKDFFNICEKKKVIPTFDDIWAAVMPYLERSRVKPTPQALLKILKEIAHPVDGKYWALYSGGAQDQAAFSFVEKHPTSLPDVKTMSHALLREHDTFIYLLAKLGLACGFLVHVGKKEQALGAVRGEKLSDLSIKEIPKLSKATAFSRKHVEQIDLVWLDKDGVPIAAFEVENTTKCEKTFDRFIELINFAPQVRQNNRCFVIAHEDNLRLLTDKLTQSHYCAYPLLMHRAVSFFLFEEFLQFYRGLKLGIQPDPVTILTALEKGATRVQIEEKIDVLVKRGRFDS